MTQRSKWRFKSIYFRMARLGRTKLGPSVLLFLALFSVQSLGEDNHQNLHFIGQHFGRFVVPIPSQTPSPVPSATPSFQMVTATDQAGNIIYLPLTKTVSFPREHDDFPKGLVEALPKAKAIGAVRTWDSGAGLWSAIQRVNRGLVPVPTNSPPYSLVPDYFWSSQYNGQVWWDYLLENGSKTFKEPALDLSTNESYQKGASYCKTCAVFDQNHKCTQWDKAKTIGSATDHTTYECYVLTGSTGEAKERELNREFAHAFCEANIRKKREFFQDDNPENNHLDDLDNVKIWERLKSLIDAAVYNQAEVLHTIGPGIPQWASGDPCQEFVYGTGGATPPSSPDHLNSFINFLSVLFSNNIGRIQFYEIWNEPMFLPRYGGGAFFSGNTKLDNPFCADPDYFNQELKDKTPANFDQCLKDRKRVALGNAKELWGLQQLAQKTLRKAEKDSPYKGEVRARMLSPGFMGDISKYKDALDPETSCSLCTYLDVVQAEAVELSKLSGKKVTTAELFKTYTDAFAYHFYVKRPEDFLALKQSIEQTLASYGITDLPIINTEGGYEVSSKVPDDQLPYVSEKNLPGWLARNYIWSNYAGLLRSFYYTYDSYSGKFSNEDGSLKPAGTAQAQIAKWLVGATLGTCYQSEPIQDAPLNDQPSKFYSRVYWCDLVRAKAGDARLIWKAHIQLISKGADAENPDTNDGQSLRYTIPNSWASKASTYTVETLGGQIFEKLTSDPLELTGAPVLLRVGSQSSQAVWDYESSDPAVAFSSPSQCQENASYLDAVTKNPGNKLLAFYRVSNGKLVNVISSEPISKTNIATKFFSSANLQSGGLCEESQAIRFRGTSKADATSVQITTPEGLWKQDVEDTFSIEFWSNVDPIGIPKSPADYPLAISQEKYQTSGFRISPVRSAESSNRYVWRFWTTESIPVPANGVNLASSTLLETGTWNHIVILKKLHYPAHDENGDFSTERFEIYVNGVLDGAANSPRDDKKVVNPRMIEPAGGIPLVLGAAAGRFFNGTIQELALYGNSLSEEEIQNHYKAGVGLVGLPIPRKSNSKPKTYASAVRDDQPLVFLKMDELGGLKLSSQATPRPVSSAIFGQRAFALDLSGEKNVQRAVTLTYTATQTSNEPLAKNPWQSSFTIEYWQKINSFEGHVAGIQTSFTNELSKTWGFRLGNKVLGDGSDRGNVYFWNLGSAPDKTGTISLLSNTILKPNQWNHIVVTYDDVLAKFSLYVNGKLDTESVAGNRSGYVLDPTSAGSWSFTLGKYGTYYLNGALDQVAIYPRVLSAEKIRLHYLSGSNQAPLD